MQKIQIGKYLFTSKFMSSDALTCKVPVVASDLEFSIEVNEYY